MGREAISPAGRALYTGKPLMKKSGLQGNDFTTSGYLGYAILRARPRAFSGGIRRAGRFQRRGLCRGSRSGLCDVGLGAFSDRAVVRRHACF